MLFRMETFGVPERSLLRRGRRHLTWAVPLALLVAAACSSNSEIVEDGNLSGTGSTGSGSTGSGGSGSIGNGTGAFSNLGGSLGLGGAGNGATNGMGGGSVCESAQSDAELQPIYLGFAFDVSGSMGQLDHPNWWHDPTKKWMPVVEATKAFFADEASTNIFASMALFPVQGDKATKCDAESYSEPVVEMTALPSDEFADALDAYEDEVGTPLAGGAWRGNTPTLAVVNGTLDYLRAQMAEHPGAKFALVLVTDGVPAGCDGDDDIGGIADVVADALATDGIPTYVIGVENPTTPPTSLPTGWDDQGCDEDGDRVDDGTFWCTPPNALASLDQIAVAGDTTKAELIDTNNPETTKTALTNAINAIRENSISCDLDIPPHPQGGTFDKDKIDVRYLSGTKNTRLIYDPDCEEEAAWHYDDEDDPGSIVLCDATCLTVQSDPEAQLQVDFLCKPRPEIVK